MRTNYIYHRLDKCILIDCRKVGILHLSYSPPNLSTMKFSLLLAQRALATILGEI